MSTEIASATKISDMDKQCVILLHGLGRSHYSMQPIAKALRAIGFEVINLDYASQRDSIEDLALEVIPQGLAQCQALKANNIHFVTHSMGGILLRYYLALFKISALGHVVMLSPPNHGSEIVDNLKQYRVYRWYNGPAGMELGTDADSLPMKLGPVNYSTGVITGKQHSFFDFYFSELIPGQDDGKVSVASARLEGMADFLVVNESHPFIMRSETVIQQIIYFLHNGCFEYAQENVCKTP